MSTMTFPPAANDEGVGKSYQPSNGTEGGCFFAAWCEKCARDKVMNGSVRADDARDEDYCGIVARSMAYKPGEADYPSEWIYDADGIPKCTAFVPAGDPIPTPRCSATVDMFEEPKA